MADIMRWNVYSFKETANIRFQLKTVTRGGFLFVANGEIRKSNQAYVLWLVRISGSACDNDQEHQMEQWRRCSPTICRIKKYGRNHVGKASSRDVEWTLTNDRTAWCKWIECHSFTQFIGMGRKFKQLQHDIQMTPDCRNWCDNAD